MKLNNILQQFSQKRNAKRKAFILNISNSLDLQSSFSNFKTTSVTNEQKHIIINVIIIMTLDSYYTFVNLNRIFISLSLMTSNGKIHRCYRIIHQIIMSQTVNTFN